MFAATRSVRRSVRSDVIVQGCICEPELFSSFSSTSTSVQPLSLYLCLTVTACSYRFLSIITNRKIEVGVKREGTLKLNVFF